MTEEIPENEDRDQRRKRLARLRQKKYREKKTWLSQIGVRESEFSQEPISQQDNMGFGDAEPLIRKAFGKSESEKIRENKELEEQINQNLEEQTTKNLCSRCHSSICKCHQTLYQGED